MTHLTAFSISLIHLSHRVDTGRTQLTVEKCYLSQHVALTLIQLRKLETDSVCYSRFDFDKLDFPAQNENTSLTFRLVYLQPHGKVDLQMRLPVLQTFTLTQRMITMSTSAKGCDRDAFSRIEQIFASTIIIEKKISALSSHTEYK